LPWRRQNCDNCPAFMTKRSTKTSTRVVTFMFQPGRYLHAAVATAVLGAAMLVSGYGSPAMAQEGAAPKQAPAAAAAPKETVSPNYKIGPGDTLNVFVC